MQLRLFHLHRGGHAVDMHGKEFFQLKAMAREAFEQLKGRVLKTLGNVDTGGRDMFRIGRLFLRELELEQFLVAGFRIESDRFPHEAERFYRYQFVYMNPRGEITGYRNTDWIEAK